MRMSSPLSTAKRRVPTQDRSAERVRSILQTAADLVAEVGYDQVTMTAVAERAEGSIGSLYQYFPDKSAIMQALFAQYGAEMDERWTPLIDVIASLSPAEIADRLVDLLADFIDMRPAYLALFDAPLKLSRSAAARDRLRSRMAEAFAAHQPKLSKKQTRLTANVTIQILKGFGVLYARSRAEEKANLVRENKFALTAYLNARFQSPA